MNIKQNVLEVSGLELTKTILVDLQKLASCSGEPIASVYADNLLRTMRTMRDKLPFDPYTEVVMALHDALAYSNRWIDYNASQYQGVCDLLTSIVNQETINNSSVEAAILTLENLGFDTIPFGVKLDESLDLDKDEE
ncbi:hypothetical protein IQ226_16015 [Dolichospermum sp. LEGE 00240]|jgi:hypothetical protein|uniref:hypothetical protein n=1 Tax=Dolichospermum sp. LEGE 00240 TaxID=1828603 RepID=UPI00187E6B28|nr:hypothetical protein [Dolichospermum sp. LEGE 00240]MDM3844319.1 hypothetical protein [Aphanizomenon gracile PMC638.10]MDM3851813.1 hypothetical protein [Aphanizomenon gracile PMC627.10]MDM3855084.1 hypothetical protein [Aphanizomenon gracile PMC649.10]MDM3862327.1 hypothetical protein [Aphanizomenon gracile PMC644.10]MBE9250618.1 hypothetical protein [Dolichospermum sp. LEGE 00240]